MVPVPCLCACSARVPPVLCTCVCEVGQREVKQKRKTHRRVSPTTWVWKPIPAAKPTLYLCELRGGPPLLEAAMCKRRQCHNGPRQWVSSSNMSQYTTRRCRYRCKCQNNTMVHLWRKLLRNLARCWRGGRLIWYSANQSKELALGSQHSKCAGRKMRFLFVLQLLDVASDVLQGHLQRNQARGRSAHIQRTNRSPVNVPPRPPGATTKAK